MNRYDDLAWLGFLLLMLGSAVLLLLTADLF
jgi:hypothetical protein